MADIHLFHVYDLVFLLNDQNRLYCFNNLNRFRKKNFIAETLLQNHISISDNSICAVAFTEKKSFRWAGLISLDSKSRIAWLDWLIAGPSAGNDELQLLLEFLTSSAGNLGYHQLAVALGENTWMINGFKKSGFIFCAQQLLWSGMISKIRVPTNWHFISSRDFSEAGSFYQSQVPLVNRQIERTCQDQKYFALLENNQILAYAKVIQTNDLIYIEPVVQPGLKKGGQTLRELAGLLCRKDRTRCLIAVPSFQSQLGVLLRSEGFRMESEQTIYIKNMVVPVEKKNIAFGFEKPNAIPLEFQNMMGKKMFSDENINKQR